MAQELEPIELMKVTKSQMGIPLVSGEQVAKSSCEIESKMSSLQASVSDRRESNQSMSDATSCSSQSSSPDLADAVLAAIEGHHPHPRLSQALRPVTFVTNNSSFKVPKVTGENIINLSGMLTTARSLEAREPYKKAKELIMARDP